MANRRTSDSRKKGPNDTQTGSQTAGRAAIQPRASRAHRDDTPEGAAQRGRIPKTHPNRAPSAARKDTKLGERRRDA